MSHHAARTRRTKRPAASTRSQETNSEQLAGQLVDGLHSGNESLPAAVTGLTTARPSSLLRSSADPVADPLGGSAIPGDVVSALRRRAGRGAALPEHLADQIGTELGGDVSAARVHTDAEADTLARSVSAVAFTYGTDIYFSSGSFNPGNPAGQHLLAHELSHVVQAQHGTNTSAHGTIGAADDPAEHAADASATRVVSALRRRAAAPTGAGDHSPEPADAEHAASAASRTAGDAVRRTASPAAEHSRAAERVAGEPGRVHLSVAADQQAGQPAASDATAAEVIRRLLVKVNTARIEDSKTRVIVEVLVAERAPTTVSKGQGDHTVAETLIVEAVRGICHLQQYWPAYVALLNNVPTFADSNKIDRYDVDAIIEEFRQTDEKTFTGMDGEDQVASIERLIDTLIRSANKVPNSAFAKKEGLTSGGGKEKAAIEKIREIAGGGAASLQVLLAVAPHIVELIDYTKFDPVLADACVRALKLAFSAAPPLSTKQHLLVPLLVDALMSTRFPGILGGGDTLLAAVSKALGQSTEEVSLKDWGKEEAELQPTKVNKLIAPELEAMLLQIGPGHGGPPVPVFQSAPVRTPQIVATTRLNGQPGAPILNNGSFVQLSDGWYLVVNSSGSSTGQTSYDVAKLVTHEVLDSPGLASHGPELGAIVELNSKPHKVVHIQGSPGGKVYFLALAA
ncbi:MAG: hypothetical protein QOE23_422 [Pseudonocardiales bacterium]|jgi:hypothetical protein|nr:hypothetical protein [Pseudonocardiales bacterium]